MPEYNIRLTIRTSMEKIVEADSLELAKDKMWMDLIDMDPKKGHYILINGSKHYELVEEVVDDEN